jgi:hypothetical protein
VLLPLDLDLGHVELGRHNLQSLLIWVLPLDFAVRLQRFSVVLQVPETLAESPSEQRFFAEESPTTFANQQNAVFAECLPLLRSELRLPAEHFLAQKGQEGFCVGGWGWVGYQLVTLSF